MKSRLTRKEFFDTTAKAAAAVTAGVVGGRLLAAGAGQVQVPITPNAAVPGFPWPWPYVALDPEDIRKRAHRDYYSGGCGYGAFNAIVGGLADKVGAPFTLLPTQMLYYGSGGGAGWGTLCGALNGVGAAISLVVDRTNASAIIGELFGWYTTVKFPSDTSNDYAVKRLFLVNKNDRALKQSTSSTPLCHGSVSKWCTESFFKATSPERAERCARLTGDTAARAVELVNQFVEGRFKASFAPVGAVAECKTCHTTGDDNVLSGVKMDCRQCHNDTWDHLW